VKLLIAQNNSGVKVGGTKPKLEVEWVNMFYSEDTLLTVHGCIVHLPVI
jgi:hypothetical protein